MLSLRTPRFFAFVVRAPTVPLPFRVNVTPLLQLIGRRPAKRAPREKIVRKKSAHPQTGSYVVRLKQRDGAGIRIGRRRRLFCAV